MVDYALRIGSIVECIDPEPFNSLLAKGDVVRVFASVVNAKGVNYVRIESYPVGRWWCWDEFPARGLRLKG